MKIAFDVDDTLYRIRIRNIGGRPVQDQVPDLDLIRVLRFTDNGVRERRTCGRIGNGGSQATHRQ